MSATHSAIETYKNVPAGKTAFWSTSCVLRSEASGDCWRPAGSARLKFDLVAMLRDGNDSEILYDPVYVILILKAATSPEVHGSGGGCGVVRNVEKMTRSSVPVRSEPPAPLLICT
jgi:hypothetical protein